MIKRKRIKHLLFSLLCFAILTFTSCGTQALVKSSSYQAEYLPEEDYNFQSYYLLGQVQRITQSEEGFYFIAGEYLFFMDWDTKQSIPLCFKTDCLHTDETDSEKIPFCDAFLGVGAASTPFIAYYQNKLYTICLDRTTSYSNLIEMNLDGTERKVLFSFSNITPSWMFMHRGVIYFVSNLKNLDGENHYGLNAFSVLSGSGEPIQIYSGTNENGWIQNVLAYQNNIFFQDWFETEDSYANSVIMYDIHTGKCMQILDESNTIYGIENDGLLLRDNNTGLYSVYSLKNESLLPSQRNYDAFLQAHPQWQCHCENSNEDMTLFSCYDLEIDDFVWDSYVVNSQGEIVAVIPDSAWIINGSYIFTINGEEYVFRCFSNYSIKAYATKDLLKGFVNPITIFDGNNYDDLIPGYLLHTGE